MHSDRFITLHGRRYHYTEWGEPAAPPLVMLHGITTHARTWDDEARLLAARYRVLALDQRGHGDSDPPPDADYSDAALLSDLEAFVEALGLGRITLVALSLGGRVAINCPSLLVRGALSDMLSEDTAKRMADELPTARLVVVPGAGHTVPGDQPALFQSLLREFLMP